MPKRIYFLVTTFIFFFALSLKTAHADINPVVNPVGAAAQTVDDIADFCKARSGNVMNLETWYSGKCVNNIDEIVGNSTNTGQYRGFSDIVLLDLITHVIPENPTLITTSQGNSQNNTAAIPALTKILTATLTTPPASGLEYLAHVSKNLQNANIVQPAYAESGATGAGTGFNKLLPILPAWEGVRNISYTLFILVFVVYGFMMMFRTKINPQTVINFELAIPKLVITLLAITFSYAIAGVIIDLSLLIPAFLVNVLIAAKVINNTVELPSFISQIPGISGSLQALNQQLNPVQVVTGQSWLGGAFLGLEVLYKIIFTAGPSTIASLLTGLPTILYQVVFTISGLGLLIKLILVFAFLYVLVKITFMAIQAYAMIVINIIFAPLILLGNVFPGSKSLGDWMRGLLANIAIFPTIMIMFMIAITFLGGSLTNGKDLWVPAYFMGSSNINILGTNINDARGVGALIAYALIFLTPKVADIVRDTLKAPAFKYGAAIGEALQYGYGRADIATRDSNSAFNTAYKNAGLPTPGSLVSRAKKLGVKPNPPKII